MTGRLEEEHWKEVLAELSCSLARGYGLILAAVRHFITNELKSDNHYDLPLSGRPDEFRDGLG